MGARGLNLALEGHPINILSPQNISGGKNSIPFTLRGASKANIFAIFGATAAALTGLQLFAGADTNMTNAVPIAFDVYKQEVSGNVNDVLVARTPVAAAGYVPAANNDTFAVIHIQADQVPAGLPWLQLRLANGANANLAAALAILTGLRYGGESNPTATS